MRIETIMEISDSFVRAYQSYKNLLKRKDEHESEDLLLTRVALMFGIDSIKKFKMFVMNKEKNEERIDPYNY